jgi:oxalate decarboxylase/phosphoglucose isomerase-like protein (cupin superfamily)
VSLNVFATCENKSNKEEILRVDDATIRKDLNRFCTELLGHEYQDGVISGYSLEVDFVKNETKENDVPYDETITENKKVRVFSESVNTDELKWHRDREDRLVEVIDGNGWELQFDNELPFKLKKGMSVIIPEGVYHRVIKGNGNLKVSITILD